MSSLLGKKGEATWSVPITPLYNPYNLDNLVFFPVEIPMTFIPSISPSMGQGRPSLICSKP